MEKRGVSLIEVILAVAISAAVFSAAIPLINNTITANRKAKLKLLAYQAAHREIENYKNVNIKNFASHSFTIPDLPGSTGELTVNKPHEDLAEINSRVRWKFKTKDEVIELKTLIYGVAE